MNIVVDENIPLITIRALREMGHEVLDIRGTPDEGMADDALWERARREERLLITTDKGFTQHRGQRHHGILIVRLHKPNRREIDQRVLQAITQFGPEEWRDLVVVMRDTVQSVWRKSEES